MARKIKKALRKVAKAAVPMLAVAGLGKAFMDARNRKASMADVEANEAGFGDMKLKDFGPYTIGDNFMPQEPTVVNRGRNRIVMSDGTIITPGTARLMKKGGRVKKGFAKKKKQANKMRKK